MPSSQSSVRPDYPRWSLQFLAWCGLVIGLVGAMQFIGTSISLSRLYWVLVTRGRWIDLLYFFSMGLQSALSLLLILGSAGLIMGRQRARMLLMVWAVLFLLTGVAHDILVIVRGTDYFVHFRWGDWPWIVRSFFNWGLSLGFPLTVLCVMALPQTRTALTILPGAAFRVLRRGESRSANLPDIDRAYEMDTAARVDVLNLGDVFRHNLIIAIAGVGIFLGAISTTMCLLQLNWPQYVWFGGLIYGLPDNWRAGMVHWLDWIIRWSSVLLLVGSLETFARRELGRQILWLWGICHSAAAIMMFVLYDLMHIAWEMGSSPGNIIYRSEDISYTLSTALTANAFAVIVAVLLFDGAGKPQGRVLHFD